MKVDINIKKYQQNIFFYIIRDYLEYNLILRKLWIIYYNIKIALKINIFFIYFSETKIRTNKKRKKRLLNFLKIGITVFQFWIK